MVVVNGYEPPTMLKNSLILSFSSYCGLHVYPNFDCYWCQKYPNKFTLVGLFGRPDDASFGFVGFDVSLKQIFIIHRGSDNWSGFVSDVSGWYDRSTLPWANATSFYVRVHKGFLNVQLSSFDQVEMLIATAKTNCGLDCQVGSQIEIFNQNVKHKQTITNS